MRRQGKILISSLVLLLIIGVSVTVALVLTASDASEEDFELIVVHLNDFHDRFDEISSSFGACSPPAPCFGGIARVGYLAQEILQSTSNSIFLNAGDNFQGTLWYTVFRWNVTATFLNMLPFDALTLGNHEFDNGIDGVAPFMENLNFPVVIANMNVSQEPRMEGKYKKSIIIERGGRKIGITGYILKNVHDISRTENLIFTDEAEAVEAEAAVLKSQGANIIIAVSHAGFDVDKEVAIKAKDLDIIVGGHSHSLLYTGTPPDNDSAVDVYPYIVKQESGRKVAIVQALAYSKYLGNLTARFDSDGELIEAVGNPIILDASIPQDENILEALVPWRNSLTDIGARSVATTKVYLEADKGVCHAGECNVGNLLADAMVNEHVNDTEEGYWTQASIALVNSGGIRASITETNNGIVTFNDLIMMSPFQNTIDTMEILGSDLLSALEFSVSQQQKWTAMGSHKDTYYSQVFLQQSGLKVTYDLSKPVGKRVTSVKVRCAKCRVPIYEDLSPTTWYRITVPSFLSEGGDGYAMFKDKTRNRTIGRLDSDVYGDYMRKVSPITEGLDFRTTVIYDSKQKIDL